MSGAAAPSPWVDAVIERIVPRTPRLTSFFLRAPWAAHVAGQHVDVRLTAPDGYQARRSYSIASAPGDPLIELLIERLDDGEVSPYFHDVARPGDSIDVRGPLGGHFIWRAADGGPLLLIAGGSGIAPLLAIVRDWARAPATPLLLVVSVRTWEDVACRDELLGLQAREPAFGLRLVTTRGKRQRPDDLERRLDGAVLGGLIEQGGHVPRHVYVCGSNAFVEAITTGLHVPADRVRTERYGGAG